MRGGKTLKTLAQSIGPNAHVGTPAEAAQSGELVLLATPWREVEDALRAAGAMEGSLQGKILVECRNPLTADFSALTIGYTTSGSEEIAKLAVGANVVKAFNTIFAHVLAWETQLYQCR